MDHRAIRRLFDYWEELRAGRPAPARSEIDPAAFEEALEHAFLLEAAGPGNIRFRLAGLGLCTLMGMEVRGMTPLALFTLAARPRVEALMNRVFGAEAFVDLEMLAGEDGKPPLRGRMILLPIQSDGGVFDRALGCLVTHGEIGQPPRRFSLEKGRAMRIIARQPPAPPRWKSAPIAGFAAPAVPAFDMGGAAMADGSVAGAGRAAEELRLARLRAEALALTRRRATSRPHDWGRAGGAPAPHLRLVVDNGNRG